MRFFRGSVIPYLAANRFRPRIRAIQKTRPILYRAKVLERALLAARSDANSFWMLLLGNAEVAFPSRTTTIEVAASLPTSATATAITNVAAAVTASARLALTNSATASLPTAATTTAIGTFTPSEAYTFDSAVAAAAPNDATPSTDQKRRARPPSYSG
jgi:hypothetical protein